MTSEERHEARYQRRKQRREQKRRESLREANDFEKVIGYRALFEATRKCRRGVYWKDGVKSYCCYALLNNAILHPRRVSGLAGELRKEERQKNLADDGRIIQQTVRYTENYTTDYGREKA